jgi:hypothetical protein
MNERKRIEIAELKLEKYHAQGGVCPMCGEPVTVDGGELAHRIPQRKWCIAKYGPRIIHHRDNLVLTHTGSCNSAVSIGNHPVECERLAQSINDRMLRLE